MSICKCVYKSKKFNKNYLHREYLFDIIFLGTFNKLGGAIPQKEGRRYNEQERFFNLRFSNYYLPFTIIVIRSFNIKEIHLTQQ